MCEAREARGRAEPDPLLRRGLAGLYFADTEHRTLAAFHPLVPDGASWPVVGKGATLCAGAILWAGVTIGPYAVVMPGAVVTEDVPAHAIVVGNPAAVVGYACECGAELQLGLVGNWLTTLPDNKRRFRCLQPGARVTCAACGESWDPEEILSCDDTKPNPNP